MSKDEAAISVLVLRLWTHSLEPIAAALRAAGINARLTCVDFEAALHAALVHERFDLAIYDPATPGLCRHQVDAAFLAHDRAIPLIDLGDVTTLGARAAALLTPTRN